MKVVFCDIDGVLKPIGSCRGMLDAASAVSEVSRQLGEGYESLDPLDVSAAFLDWDGRSCELLAFALEQADAKLVIASEWCAYDDDEEMGMLLRIQGLDERYAGCVRGVDKASAILSFLAKHEDIGQWCAVDDRDLPFEQALKPAGESLGWIEAISIMRMLGERHG